MQIDAFFCLNGANIKMQNHLVGNGSVCVYVCYNVITSAIYTAILGMHNNLYCYFKDALSQ